MVSRRQAMVERDIDIAFAGLLPPEFQQAHAEFARAVLREHLSTLDAKPDVTVIVDGNKGASEDSVKPFGLIRYEFSRLGDAVDELLFWLRRESPVETGTFRDSFFVGINGRKVMWDAFRADRVPPDAEIIVGNEVSYNRKIDVQLVGLTPLRFNVDPFLYDRAVRWLKRRHPAIEARRQYSISFDGQYILKTGPRAGKPVHSPGIIINRR